MSANDFVKYLTEQIVAYLSEPRTIKKEKKQLKKEQKAPFLFRWFGLIPAAIAAGLRKRKG